MSIIAASKTNRLGTKRTCRSCGARFYDLEKPEPVCPKCKAVFDVHAEPVLPALEPLTAEELAENEEVETERRARKKRRDENGDEDGPSEVDRDD